MEADSVMNFILRFYHLEHVASGRHPAFAYIIWLKLFMLPSSLSMHSEVTTGTRPYCVHIIHMSNE